MTQVLRSILGISSLNNLDCRLLRMHSLSFATQMQTEEDMYTCAKNKDNDSEAAANLVEPSIEESEE